MGEYVRFALPEGGTMPPEGGTVLVEVGDDGGGVSRAGRGERITDDAAMAFATAFAQVRSAASVALDQFVRLPRRPDEVELKFGVKLDAQAGAIIARTGAQAQFEVKLRWQSGDWPRREEEQVEDDGAAPEPA